MKWLFLVVLVAPGLLWLYLVVPRAYSGVRTLSWQPTDGKVMESSTRFDHNSKLQRTKGTFSYRYFVDGKAYTSSRVGYAGLSGAGWATWDAGDTVTVYVDPSDPSRAVLERGIDVWNGVQIAGGLILLVGGAAAFAFSTWRERQSAWVDNLVVEPYVSPFGDDEADEGDASEEEPRP